MIEYIVNNAYGCLVYKEDRIKQLKKSNLSYVKELCISSLFTYKGYLKANKIENKLVSKVPVYINDQTMLIPIKRTRDYDNIWINYAAIKNMLPDGKGLKVIFHSNREVAIDNSANQLMKQITQLKMIRKMKSKHFHF